jgi:UDP-N-acetylmuramate--alanine ligase
MTAVPSLPAPPARIHFIGIGGIGMSGLARMLDRMGYRVSGSDAYGSALIDELRQSGIAVEVGHRAEHLPRDTALVVRTSAVGPDNPEYQAADRRGVPVIRRAELLGAIAATRTTIAVAGTHGKSTTSAMLATALIELGHDPSYAVGAVLSATGTNAALGSGNLMIVEADEYDRSFLALRPAYGVITNCEFDHPDIFADAAEYEAAFVDFACRVDPGGSLVIRGDDSGSMRVAEQTRQQSNIRVRTFGRDPGLDWSAAPAGDGWRLRGPAGTQVTASLPVPGAHNVMNALAATVVLTELGIAPQQTVAALECYQGIGRRFEWKGEAAGVLVIDDYAHHPTEVTATLTAARERFPDRRIWAAFQPHTFSRTAALLDDFAGALSLVENRLVLDVYGARETNDGSITERDMSALAGSGGLRAGTVTEAAEALARNVAPGDIVLTMGAGDVTALGPLLLERLATQSEREG